MAELTTLKLPAGADGARVVSLSSLEHASNLTSLHLSGHDVSDVSALSCLNSLTALDLGGNTISDISPLSTLTGLVSLGLSGNSVADISALSGLNGLAALDLSDNNIAAITALSGLNSLRRLHLGRNRITSIEPLRGLTSLEDLYIGDNHITVLGLHAPRRRSPTRLRAELDIARHDYHRLRRHAPSSHRIDHPRARRSDPHELSRDSLHRHGRQPATTDTDSSARRRQQRGSRPNCATRLRRAIGSRSPPVLAADCASGRRLGGSRARRDRPSLPPGVSGASRGFARGIGQHQITGVRRWWPRPARGQRPVRGSGAACRPSRRRRGPSAPRCPGAGRCGAR